jgi:uncharacterized protein YbjT (DUF2867 family)
MLEAANFRERNAMILVTGPNGNVGTELVRMLIADGRLPFRIAANTPSKIEALYGPNAPKVRFSFADKGTWDAALDGVSTVFLLFPLPPAGNLNDLQAPAFKARISTNIRQATH